MLGAVLILRAFHRPPDRAPHPGGGSVRIMGAGVVVAVLVAARFACHKFAVLGVACAAVAYNAWQLVESRHFASLVGLVLSVAAMVMSYLERRRLDHSGQLTQEVEGLSRLVTRNSLRIGEQERLLELSDARALRLEAELEQVSEQVLRLKGFAHSGSRRALRTRPSGPPRRVLIVEDHEPTGERLARYLELNGLQVEVSGTADEALGLLRAGHPYDVVLLDLLMPGDPGDDAPGLAVLRAIRQGKAPPPGVVVVTGSDNPAHHERARVHGAAAILVKPVDLDELLALLGVAGEAA